MKEVSKFMATRWFASIIFSLLLVSGLSAQSTPGLVSVMPSAVLAGSSDTQITVKGNNFDSSTVVSLNGQNISTTFVSSSTVQAVIPASLLVAPVSFLVNVSNAGVSSPHGISIFVQSTSPPTVTSLHPDGGARGLMAVPLFVLGANVTGASLSTNGTGVNFFGGFAPGGIATIAADAPLGPQAITVSTLAGSTSTCGAQPCTFTVVEPGTWTDVTPPGVTSFSPGPVVKLLDGRLLMIGGATEEAGNPVTPVSSVQIFDPSTLRWTSTGSMMNARVAAAASLLPDGRVLAVGGNDASGATLPGEIYDPASGTWSLTGKMTSPIASKALLLPNGKVLVSYNSTTFGAELFDPVSGTFQVLPALDFQTPRNPSSTELLPDGRVLLVGPNTRIYDPASGTVSTPAQTRALGVSEITKLLPDGRVLVEAIQGGVAAWGAYDPSTNTFQDLLYSIDIVGSPVLLPDGSVLISGEELVPNGTFGAQTAQYDPVHDQLFRQPTAARPAAPSLLLDDGRAFGIEYRYSAQDSAHSGTFAQIYTPPSSTNPAPVVSSAVYSASTSQFLVLDIHGSSFLPNASVLLGSTRLVTLYLGSQHLVAFVPVSRFSSLSEGASVNNPGPGTGSTASVPAGYTATVPLPISDVETGSVHTGYVIVTADPGSALPVTTLTYGTVSGAIVQSQATASPTPLTATTSMGLNVVPGIGRNLGVAIANPGGTSAQITLTLYAANGDAVGTPATLSIPAGGQIARWVTELFPATSLGAAFRGSVSVQSSTPVSIIGFQFSGAQFSTLTVPLSNPAAVPANGPVGGPNAAMFPQFVMSAGWATALDLLNNTSSPTTGRVDVFDPGGNPLAVQWNGSSQSSFIYSIPPNGTVSLSPRDTNGQSPF
jgi:hypothetical protein